MHVPRQQPQLHRSGSDWAPVAAEDSSPPLSAATWAYMGRGRPAARSVPSVDFPPRRVVAADKQAAPLRSTMAILSARVYFSLPPNVSLATILYIDCMVDRSTYGRQTNKRPTCMVPMERGDKPRHETMHESNISSDPTRPRRWSQVGGTRPTPAMQCTDSGRACIHHRRSTVYWLPIADTPIDLLP